VTTMTMNGGEADPKAVQLQLPYELIKSEVGH